MWKLNSILLDDQWIIEIKRNSENTLSEKKPHQKLQDALLRPVLSEKLSNVTINNHIKKGKISSQ